MITPSLLAVNQYSLKTDWLLFFLSAMGNTDNNLPTGILATLRIARTLSHWVFMMTDQKALCKEKLHLLLRNK